MCGKKTSSLTIFIEFLGMLTFDSCSRIYEAETTKESEELLEFSWPVPKNRSDFQEGTLWTIEGNISILLYIDVVMTTTVLLFVH